MNDVFDVFEDHNPWTLVTSQLIVGMILSPLELVRTRLIVQSLAPLKKRYHGTFHALGEISKENENSRLGSFFTSRTIIPTLLLNTVSPLIRYFCTHVIEAQLGLNSSFNPIMFKIFQLAFIGVEAFLTCPLELARTRLFARTISSDDSGNLKSTDLLKLVSYDACVELAPVHSNGVFKCIIDVITIEGGRSAPSKPASSKISIDEWENVYGGGAQLQTSESGMLGRLNGYRKGFFSLYRGFWPRYVTLLIQFLSSEINKDD